MGLLDKVDNMDDEKPAKAKPKAAKAVAKAVPKAVAKKATPKAAKPAPKKAKKKGKLVFVVDTLTHSVILSFHFCN